MKLTNGVHRTCYVLNNVLSTWAVSLEQPLCYKPEKAANSEVSVFEMHQAF